jgi:hypothetical protein
MLMTVERPLTIRTLRGWAISALQEAGAIRECDEHGSVWDRADPHARDCALTTALGCPVRRVWRRSRRRGPRRAGVHRRHLPQMSARLLGVFSAPRPNLRRLRSGGP